MRFEFKAMILVCICLCGLQALHAQPAVASTAVDMKASHRSDNTTDMRYRIGPGDVLEVRVARAPELSREAVRVDQSGHIRMPMLDDDIPAACLTEAELAQGIAKLYLKYKRDPHVDVFVKEFQSQPVAVIGAVRNPAQFKLQRQVHLLELMSLVGGPTETAGQTIQVVHAEGGMICEQSAGASITETGAFTTYKLNDTLHGTAEANPVVRPGDIISVPQADQVFVIGNVMKPTAIPLKEPLTLSKAIAMAGGTAPSTKRDKIRIIRQVNGTEKQEITVDLTSIEKNQTQDVALVANDVIDVPVSGTKRLLRSLLGAVVPSVGQLPVRVIP
ncbi:MAG TPA: polysaccharide biosynthesis/export family protein [Pyrinomonadaceae bacterium]|nr:polysaccharide biosynthesis/export family protein [Pyrinomonadaceae bacterium]